MTATNELVDDPYRNYGDKIVAVEPAGIDYIPEADRHGSAIQLLWTWTSPNMEFATIAVGILGPSLGLSVWKTFAAIVLGTVLGAAAQGVGWVTARGGAPVDQPAGSRIRVALTDPRWVEVGLGRYGNSSYEFKVHGS